MPSVGSVVLGASDVPRAAAFWTEALGYAPREEREDDWVVLAPAESTGVQLSLGLTEAPLQEHPRIHLDLYAGDSADQAAEVERLVSLGAQIVDWDLYPDDADFVVLADPRVTAFALSTPGATEEVGTKPRPARNPLSCLRAYDSAVALKRPGATRLPSGRARSISGPPNRGFCCRAGQAPFPGWIQTRPV
ncbi:VOC family protein [Amycolatopsis sp. NPDC049253]|uniref:VOC family protein n=1 Tax=Amycolatopsis sp. NPDC049253 TaxID=3155274 RepID=UPI003413D44B